MHIFLFLMQKSYAGYLLLVYFIVYLIIIMNIAKLTFTSSLSGLFLYLGTEEIPVLLFGVLLVIDFVL